MPVNLDVVELAWIVFVGFLRVDLMDFFVVEILRGGELLPGLEWSLWAIRFFLSQDPEWVAKQLKTSVFFEHKAVNLGGESSGASGTPNSTTYLRQQQKLIASAREIVNGDSHSTNRSRDQLGILPTQSSRKYTAVKPIKADGCLQTQYHEEKPTTTSETEFNRVEVNKTRPPSHSTLAPRKAAEMAAARKCHQITTKWRLHLPASVAKQWPGITRPPPSTYAA
ncbi:hypothetical protein Nepgr_033742 [Nepenthes gracilis]|uniref:Uncharacterized protein n=1 Tax=Nepenthes gracilis TaxID=150966 RepID=A0AAD3TMX3_NEPGR|nr:hypothetical protein Nepgr_033742 [Nepenthes gracilis]